MWSETLVLLQDRSQNNRIRSWSWSCELWSWSWSWSCEVGLVNGMNGLARLGDKTLRDLVMLKCNKRYIWSLKMHDCWLMMTFAGRFCTCELQLQFYVFTCIIALWYRSVVLVLVLWIRSWSWSCELWSWSWSCEVGLVPITECWLLWYRREDKTTDQMIW